MYVTLSLYHEKTILHVGKTRGGGGGGSSGGSGGGGVRACVCVLITVCQRGFDGKHLNI